MLSLDVLSHQYAESTDDSSSSATACLTLLMWTVFQAFATRVYTVQVLQKAGLSDVQLVQLSSNVYHLQCAFERMAVIKEYRYSIQTMFRCPCIICCCQPSSAAEERVALSTASSTTYSVPSISCEISHSV